MPSRRCLPSKNPCRCKFTEEMPVDSVGKACEIRLCSLKRTHMRAFWASTLSFFLAFVGWFAMAPLMTTIKKELKLTKDEVYNSNILAVAATVLARFIVGPLCDRYGARRPMAAILLICSIPLGCAVLIQDALGLYLVRFFVGFAGATFVPCQFWTSSMFTGRIVGTANALAGGWGNLGGGVTQGLTIGFFEMFKGAGCSANMAWRWALVIPAVSWVICAVVIWFVTDDCPQGKWRDRSGPTSAKHSTWKSLCGAAKEPFTWILLICYACGFGVEIFVNKSIAAYLQDKWKLDASVAAGLATLAGLMNIFSRFLGGWCSDLIARRMFLRGRMIVISICLALSGAFLCAMSAMDELWAATLLMVIFSIFCQASCGAVYGLVPFVSLQYGGMVSGIVGGGGSLGAMCWSFVEKVFGNQNREDMAYLVIGLVGLASSLAPLCGRLHGAALLPCFGNDGQEWEEALSKAKCDPGTWDEKDEEDPEKGSKDGSSTEETELTYDPAQVVTEPVESVLMSHSPVPNEMVLAPTPQSHVDVDYGTAPGPRPAL